MPLGPTLSPSWLLAPAVPGNALHCVGTAPALYLLPTRSTQYDPGSAAILRRWRIRAASVRSTRSPVAGRSRFAHAWLLRSRSAAHLSRSLLDHAEQTCWLKQSAACRASHRASAHIVPPSTPVA